MIFLKRTLRTTSILKLGRFIAAFGSYRKKTLKNVNFGQNFPAYTMIFSKKTTRIVSIPKIMRVYSGVWKI